MNNIKEIKKQASKVFWSSLQYKKVPSKEALSLATERTEVFLQEQVLSDNWIIDRTRIGTSDVEKAKSLIKSYLIEEKIKLPVIPPLVNSQASMLRLAVAGGVGSLAGGLLFEALARFVHLSSSLGLLIGGVVGAFLFVFLLGALAKNPKLRKRLLLILGIASFSSLSFFSLKKSLRGKRNILKRLGILITALFVILFMKSEDKFNKTLYSEYLDDVIDLWLRHISLVYELTAKMLGKEDFDENNNQIISFLVEELDKIGRLENKTDVKREVSFAGQYLKRLGIGEPESESLKLDAGNKKLIWNDSYLEFYERYGSIEDGDPFFVETEAIVKNGIVLKKGLARKKRG